MAEKKSQDPTGNNDVDSGQTPSEIPDPPPSVFEKLPYVEHLFCIENKIIEEQSQIALKCLQEELKAEQTFWKGWHSKPQGSESSGASKSDVTDKILELECKKDKKNQEKAQIDQWIKEKAAEQKAVAQEINDLLNKHVKPTHESISQLEEEIERLRIDLEATNDDQTALKEMLDGQIKAKCDAKEAQENLISLDPPGSLYTLYKEKLTAWRKCNRELKYLKIGVDKDACTMGEDTSQDKYKDLKYSKQSLEIKIAKIDKKIEYLKSNQTELEQALTEASS